MPNFIPIRDAQILLAKANYYRGAIDGDVGPKTWRAVEITEENDPRWAEIRARFEADEDVPNWPPNRRLTAAAQRVLEAMGYGPGAVDGLYGHNTAEAFNDFMSEHFGLDASVEKTVDPDRKAPTNTRATYPHQSKAKDYFGLAGLAACTRGIVRLPTTFYFSWAPQTGTKSFRCHERLADPFTEFFAEAHAMLGEDEFTRMRLHIFGGCYNNRKVRGGSTKSQHAYGAAIDLDPVRNQLRWGSDRAWFARPEYTDFFDLVEAFGFTSGGRAWGRDWMHIQALGA
jgi:peptidoglycan hydrolase-like protein with peptidoglycan-binding domain